MYIIYEKMSNVMGIIQRLYIGTPMYTLIK